MFICTSKRFFTFDIKVSILIFCKSVKGVVYFFLQSRIFVGNINCYNKTRIVTFKSSVKVRSGVQTPISRLYLQSWLMNIEQGAVRLRRPRCYAPHCINTTIFTMARFSKWNQWYIHSRVDLSPEIPPDCNLFSASNEAGFIKCRRNRHDLIMNPVTFAALDIIHITLTSALNLR